MAIRQSPIRGFNPEGDTFSGSLRRAPVHFQRSMLKGRVWIDGNARISAMRFPKLCYHILPAVREMGAGGKSEAVARGHMVPE